MLTAAVVALLVGPPIFHDHLVQAGHPPNSPELVHIERAYAYATTLSIGVGLLIAVLAAFAVTFLITRRLRRPLDRLTRAARELSRGHYATRVPATGAGAELDTLAQAINSMASRLQHVEDTRRRLLADLSHEMRTPIATLTAFHDGLREGVIGWNDEVAQVLTDQTNRLARLARDITEVSTAEEGRIPLRRSPHQMAALVRSAAENTRAGATAKGVALLIELDQAEQLSVDVDRERVGQVLANLLDNALRHTPTGGTITVAARRNGDEAEIAVPDTGDGIAVEQLPHVFERFYRGDAARDRDRSGSGVGPTISRAIAEAHGGALTAASDGPDRGSRFALTLPVNARAAASQRLRSRPR